MSIFKTTVSVNTPTVTYLHIAVPLVGWTCGHIGVQGFM